MEATNKFRNLETEATTLRYTEGKDCFLQVTRVNRAVLGTQSTSVLIHCLYHLYKHQI